MSDNPSGDYKPGDEVNGHVLTSTGQWVPVSRPPAPPSLPRATTKDLPLKVLMGFVWIVVVGWFVIGNVVALLITPLSSDQRVVVLGPVAGIAIGVWLHLRWLRARALKS
jgi:hypothetical protein